MPLMTVEEVLRDELDDEQYDSCAELLRLIDELHKDITPEQWAEIRAAADAARREECGQHEPADLAAPRPQ